MWWRTLILGTSVSASGPTDIPKRYKSHTPPLIVLTKVVILCTSRSKTKGAVIFINENKVKTEHGCAASHNEGKGET